MIYEVFPILKIENILLSSSLLVACVKGELTLENESSCSNKSLLLLHILEDCNGTYELVLLSDGWKRCHLNFACNIIQAPNPESTVGRAMIVDATTRMTNIVPFGLNILNSYLMLLGSDLLISWRFVNFSRSAVA